MIAPPLAREVSLVPGHDALRSNQLLEAGLWLHLGGQEEEARSLFQRSLEMDPSNHRAQAWLARGERAPELAPRRGMWPVTDEVLGLETGHFATELLEMGRTELEVSVVLLDEAEVASAAMDSGRMPTADVVVLDDAEAFPRRGVDTLLVGVEEMLALGDATSALELLEKAEQVAPGDTRVAAARVHCTRVEQVVLEGRLGDVKQVPRLKLRMAELMKLSLDARTGFLLSRIDGRLSYEALFSVSGMPRLDTLRVLARLLDQDIITLR